MPGFTDFFMSPVTGRINLFQFPDIPDDYIIVGGLDDRPYLSPIVIDLRLEIIELRNRLSRTSFILQHASPNFDKAQALDELIPGILRHTDGVVSIAMLPYHQVWLGNEENYPEPVDRIWDDGVGHGNLPAYTPTEYNMIWVMNEEGIPILSNALTEAQTSILDIISSITSILGDIIGMISDIASLISSILSIYDWITGADAEFDDLQFQIDATQEQIGILEEAIGELEAQMEAQIEAIAEINLSIEAILEAIAELNISVEALIEAVAAINAQITGILTAITDIQTAITGILTSITDIEANITSIFSSITDINIALGGIDLRLDGIDVSLDGLQVQIDTGLESGLGHLADLQLQIDTGIESGMDHLATINSQIDDINSSITDINTSITDITTSITDINTEIADLTTAIGDGSVTLIGDVTGAGNVGTPFGTVLTLTLDEIPLAAADVNINTHKLTNIVDPVNPQDAATKAYVDSFVAGGTVTLTGDVTGSGVVGTPFATTLTLTLDQVPLALGEISANINKITDLVDPLDPQDAATKNYVDGLVGDGTIELTGNVLGTGVVGTPFNADIASNVLTTTGDQTFSYPFASDSTAFALINTFTPTILSPSNMEFTLENSIGSGYASILSSSHSLGTFPDGVFDFISFTSSDSQSIYRATPDLFTFNIPVTMTTALSLANNEINNLVMNFSPVGYDAVNVDYLNSQIADTVDNLTLDQLGCDGNVDIDSHYIVGVLDPVSDAQAANKHYVDNSILNHNLELTGDVSGTGAIGAPINTTLELTLDEISCAGNVDINSHYILGVLDPVTGAQAANKNYVDTKFAAVPSSVTLTGAVTGSGATGTPFATTLTTTLNNVPVPTGNLSLNSFKITSLLDPTSAQDGATKNYVDTRSITLTGAVTGTAALGSSLATTLTTVLNSVPAPTGNLSLNSKKITNLLDPTLAQDAATKNYIDTKTLDTIADPVANVSMNSHKITNVTNPTAAQDAATKNYVDVVNATSAFVANSIFPTLALVASTGKLLTGFNTMAGNVNMSLTSDNVMKYTGTRTRNIVFVLTLTFSLSTTATFYVNLYKNGSPVLGALGVSFTGGSTNCVTLSYFSSAATNDTFSFYGVSSVNNSLDIDSVNCTIFGI